MAFDTTKLRAWSHTPQAQLAAIDILNTQIALDQKVADFLKASDAALNIARVDWTPEQTRDWVNQLMDITIKAMKEAA